MSDETRIVDWPQAMRPPPLPDRARHHRWRRRSRSSGCSTDQVEKLVPYLVQSEDQVPGVATWYASTCTECAAGCGVHVRTREGRAVKLEGNPEHPVNQGKLCSRGQAALQGLYNPGRHQGRRWPAARRDVRGDHLGRCDRPAGRRSSALPAGKVAVDLAARGGERSPIFSPSGPPRSAGGWFATSRSTTSRCGRPTARCSAWTSSPAHDFARAQVHRLLRRGLPGDLASAPSRTSAASPSPTDSPTATWPSSSTPAPRMDLTGLNADEWLPVQPGTETALALAMANVVC